MEEESTFCEKKRRRVPWILLFFLVLAALLTFFPTRRSPKPLSPEITLEALAHSMGNKNISRIYTQVFLSSHQSSEEPEHRLLGAATYLEVGGAPEFAAQFSFDEWELSQEKPAGEMLLGLTFAEEWVLALYEDGKAIAYYGYATSGYKDYAYYNIPDTAVDAVTDYLYENGAFCSEMVNDASFQHKGIYFWF